MFPIIISSLLNSGTKGAKIVFPIKLLAVLFLMFILFTVQISQKIFKIGKNDFLDKSVPLISASIQNALAQGCIPGGCAGNCMMCIDCSPCFIGDCGWGSCTCALGDCGYGCSNSLVSCGACGDCAAPTVNIKVQ